jgi:FO synthase
MVTNWRSTVRSGLWGHKLAARSFKGRLLSQVHRDVSLLDSVKTPDEALEILESYSVQELVAMAGQQRDLLPNGDHITFSPKVFIPVTRLCRDKCSYCTFVKEPQNGRNVYMTINEVLDTARLGELHGCTEALLTLGDKPELKYPQAREELLSLGFESTIDYVKACAAAVLEETSLVPHINSGIMTEDELLKLREVSASMGLMLESTSKALLQPGMPHHECPDKDPDRRLEMLDLAGRHKVPFTTGLLVGIGDTRWDRINGLLKIRALHERYGHIQEIIIQNFVPKVNTAMRDVEEATLDEMMFTVAACRLLMPRQNIQVPPNLSRDWSALIDAGINDFGGISPGVTPDFVSPEKPWPSLVSLSETASKANKMLLPRTCVYPGYIRDFDSCLEWLSFERKASPMRSILRAVDGDGYVRASPWYAGRLAIEDELSELGSAGSEAATSSGLSHIAGIPPARRIAAVPRMRVSKSARSVRIGNHGSLQDYDTPLGKLEKDALVERALENRSFSVEEIVNLFRARGEDFDTVVHAADALRQHVNGDEVSYVINRNINYTNICEYGCRFCAFSKGSKADDLRGPSYLLDDAEIGARVREAVENGATEVCMQGGIHPAFTGQDYLRILTAAKDACPEIHVHAFSPLEIAHGAATLNLSQKTFLGLLKDAGLGSLPGTAAEVLSDSVRGHLCPDKLTSREWADVIRAAHEVGLPTTSTIMFGHVDNYFDWATHLLMLRDIQSATGGITEFVPLPFVHMEAPMYRAGMARAGPTLHEAVLMHAIGRLVLSPQIKNVQASWVKMGPEKAADLLVAGCNDLGGTLMNESITRAAGAEFGQLVTAEDMKRLIRAAGRVPYQRSTTYARR